MLKNTLPRRLVRLRAQFNYSQARLAAAANVAQATISGLEGGQVGRDVTLGTLGSLAAALHVSPDYLLGIDDTLVARGIIPTWPAPSALNSPCPACGSAMRAGKLHTLAECIWAMHERREAQGVVAARLGLSVEAVDAVLDAEYEIQRKLRRELRGSRSTIALLQSTGVLGGSPSSRGITSAQSGR